MPFSAFARVALLSAVAAVGCNAEMLGKEWATVNRPQQVVCALDENGEVPSSWADYTRGSKFWVANYLTLSFPPHTNPEYQKKTNFGANGKRCKYRRIASRSIGAWGLYTLN